MRIPQTIMCESPLSVNKQEERKTMKNHGDGPSGTKVPQGPSPWFFYLPRRGINDIIKKNMRIISNRRHEGKTSDERIKEK